ncbi:coenzyme F420-0:L-glutamate ligase [Halobacteria archaeon AArc-curdl1]|uniref:Coenzyme F420-0:L-glutamate ligase n=1 Tax=Natronosalvus hydrolyticus TaxID=2979988 RepID=A0AAP2Z4R8_9EURY|nr:coenzyme F420-0:L-glutamate ligase [Halobacteria archaeon AArc-curdl1]
MSEITYHGIDIGLLEGGEDLVELLLEAFEESETPTLQDDDVLVVSSKVVSLAEERIVELDRVPVSPGAERIADVTGIDAREVELTLRESTILGVIPVAEIVPDRLESYAVSPEAARDALETLPALLVTNWNGRLCTNAGIDLSNSPEGTATLLPTDPNASARRLREEIRERAGADVAIVIADSEVSHRGGSVDVAIGCAGIDPVDSNFGATDLFGSPKVGGVDLLADELAAGAAVLSGQAAERRPVVLVRGVDYDRNGGIDDDVDLVRAGFWPTLKRTAQVKLAEHLPIPRR